MVAHEVPRDTLKPDFAKALQTLEERISTLSPLLRMLPFDEICAQDAIFTFRGELKVKDVPCSDKYWRWNQTKGRQTALLKNPNIKVTFYKIIPRKLPATKSMRQIKLTDREKLPSLKVWMFRLSNGTTALWCEQGLKPADQTGHYPSLEELEFLKEFVDKHLWDDFWPNQSWPKPQQQ